MGSLSLLGVSHVASGPVTHHFRAPFCSLACLPHVRVCTWNGLIPGCVLSSSLSARNDRLRNEMDLGMLNPMPVLRNLVRNSQTLDKAHHQEHHEFWFCGKPR